MKIVETAGTTVLVCDAAEALTIRVAIHRLANTPMKDQNWRKAQALALDYRDADEAKRLASIQ